MKKIAFLILATLALISGACGGGNSGWTAQEKSTLTYMISSYYGLTGDKLDCAVHYIIKRQSFGEFIAEVKSYTAYIDDGEAKDKSRLNAFESRFNALGKACHI